MNAQSRTKSFTSDRGWTALKLKKIGARKRISIGIRGTYDPKLECRIEEKRGDDWRVIGQFGNLESDSVLFLITELPRAKNLLELVKSQSNDRNSRKKFQ